MEAKKVVIWGDFRDYETYRPELLLEERKGTIEIVAVIFLDEAVVKLVDGYPVIMVEELIDISFDYIIGLEDDEVLMDMIQILGTLGISREKVLSARILKLPDFDFSVYVQLRSKEISIISDNCWGGLTYYSLNYPFLSPFINMFIKDGVDYARLVQHLPEYMNLPLEYVGTDVDGNKGNIYPVCRLGDINIHCNHYENFEQVRQIWNSRNSRINYQNIFVKMLIETEQELEEFAKIPYRKIGFSSIPTVQEDVMDFSQILRSGYLQQEYKGRFWEFVNWQARVDRVDLKHYNVMKLLLGDADYRRTLL